MIPFIARALKYDTVSDPYILDKTDKDKDKCEWSKAEKEVRYEIKNAISEINQVLSQIKETHNSACIGLTVEGKSADSEYGPEKDSNAKYGLMVLDTSDIKKLITHAVKRLSKEEQLVLSLYYCDGMNVREIGGIMGMRPASVSRLFKRAMLDLLSRVKE